MPEYSSSQNPENKTKSNHQNIANFITVFLWVELAEGIGYPDHMKRAFKSLLKTEKKQWTRFTLDFILRDAFNESSSFLGREPTAVERNLIRRRVANFVYLNFDVDWTDVFGE